MGKFLTALAVGFAATAVVALAQDHSGHGSAAEGYAAANAAMHAAMAIEYSGDPDVDFARAMIPHHAGAIAMAEVLLANGKDPELRQLAEEVIAAQQGEIAVLQAWLAANGQ